MEVATNDFELDIIRAITMVENLSSQKLLEKLGFTYDKMIRLTGEEHDVMLYENSSRPMNARAQSGAKV